jgi:ATP-dependent Lon protease
MELNQKLNQFFPGKVVRKDLTKKIKEGANVPVYVLEYLLGMYCATDEEKSIEEGLARVKKILTDNFVRPDESEKVKAKIKETGNYTIIDKLNVHLNEKNDRFEASFLNLGIDRVTIAQNLVKQYERLLAGGIWCILQMGYFFDETDKSKRSPFEIKSIKPIQMPNMDLKEIMENRKEFTKREWMDVLLRSCGYEPENFDEKSQWHLLARMIPMVENNYNLCELGPRNTGKSHIYREISPYAILVSGGQTTVPNLFVNLANNTMGLVGLWDVVAFDEVAGIQFKDKSLSQILKDYMASGSFARGKEEISANASMVFVGNINESVSALVKRSHLFAPFPEAIRNDTAFFDRMHSYVPGWEIPKMKPESFTDQYGFIVDYISEFFREMRKRQFNDSFDAFYKLGNNLNQRDVIAIRKTVGGLTKLLYPDGVFTQEEMQEILEYALITRRRVKEQLKKIGGMEFYNVHFSYIDKKTMIENFVSVPEQGGGKLIPEGATTPGHLYTVGKCQTSMLGVYKLEMQMNNGTGKFERSGLDKSSKAKENVDMAFNYFKANASNISASISTKTKDYYMQVQDLQGIGIMDDLTLAAFIALCSAALEKPIQDQMVVLGSMSIGGTINKVYELANTLQVAFDAGAKKILLPMASASDIVTIPPDLFTKFQTSFYQDPLDAVYKALGVE